MSTHLAVLEIIKKGCLEKYKNANLHQWDKKYKEINANYM
jgi:hypothetical protein